MTKKQIKTKKIFQIIGLSDFEINKIIFGRKQIKEWRK